MKAVIFDMDGLLIDTETNSKVAWQKGVEQLGFEFTEELFLSLIGRHVEECLDRLSERFELDLRETDFMERVNDCYYSNFIRHGIGVKPGVIEMLDLLGEHGIPRAVATSTKQAIAPRKLRLSQLDTYFPLIVTGCEVAQSKPAPDIFLLTAERLNIAPEECLVLEDSYAGIRGAAAAGMTPIMIPDQLPATDEMVQLTAGIYASVGEAIPTISELLFLS